MLADKAYKYRIPAFFSKFCIYVPRYSLLQLEITGKGNWPSPRCWDLAC